MSVIEEPVPRPLHSVLLARLAALRGDPVSAALHYQNALGLLPEADSLSLEAADSLEQAGYPDLARGLLERLADQGTLESRVYYELAGREAAEGDAVLASEHLETAVDLQPIQRSAVVEDADLAKMVRELGLFDLLDLSTARRRAPRIQGLARAPAELPPDALATIRGELLEIEIGDSLLEVPGGAGLAPPSAQPEDPGEAREQEDRRLLAEIPEIEDLTRGAAGFLRPRERAELVALAGALERHNRWADLVSLTDDLASRPRQMPTALATLRADALRRLGRGDEAIALLTGVARSRVEQKRRDPQALYALGRQLAASGKFDQAISLTQRAEQESPEPPLVSRLPKIRLEARLARSALVYRSAHFEIRYPVETGDFYVKRLADVLEKERLRLRKWIPEEDGPRLEVSLFPSEDFFRAYSDARDLPASYDDVLRVPLADVPSLHPLVLTLVTHTLAHALVSRATHDQAPRWFQEGLAQHVQPIQNEVNPIADYQRLGTFLSLPLLDAALSGRSDPRLAQIAYDESVWAMHFLETRYGKAGISKLVRAFGEGMTTDEAFEQVLGASTEELDHRIWAWCVADAPAAWPTEEVRYDLSPPSGIRLSRNP